MRRHLTFSNVIACLALFIALGGVSWAAIKLPKNSVTTKTIKKNAVTAAKIKRNSITSTKIKTGAVQASDVKTDALTGTQINEGTLGTVPSASTSTDQYNSFQVVNVSSSNSDPNIARANAAEVPLVSHGQVSAYGKCYADSDSNTVYGAVYGRTTATGATMVGYSTNDSLEGGPSLNPGTLEVDREIMSSAQAPNGTLYDYGNSTSIVGPNGQGVIFDLIGYIRAGNPADVPGFFSSEYSCAFHVTGGKTN